MKTKLKKLYQNMNKELYDYVEQSSLSKYTFSFESKKYFPENNSCIFAKQYNNVISILQGQAVNYLQNILKDYKEKERLYIKAINNLIKQKEYLNLLYQVSNQLITEEEFSQELEENENKYLIHVNEKLDVKKLELLSEIISNLEEDLSDDDISEIFAVRTDNIEKLIEENNESSS